MAIDGTFSPWDLVPAFLRPANDSPIVTSAASSFYQAMQDRIQFLVRAWRGPQIHPIATFTGFIQCLKDTTTNNGLQIIFMDFRDRQIDGDIKFLHFRETIQIKIIGKVGQVFSAWYDHSAHALEKGIDDFEPSRVTHLSQEGSQKRIVYNGTNRIARFFHDLQHA